MPLAKGVTMFPLTAATVDFILIFGIFATQEKR
jgi:hypothetical protein